MVWKLLLGLLWIFIILMVHESSHYIPAFLFGSNPEFTLNKWGPAVKINKNLSPYQYLVVLLAPLAPTTIVCIGFQTWILEGLQATTLNGYIGLGIILSILISGIDLWYSAKTICYGFKAKRKEVPLIVFATGKKKDEEVA